MVEDLYALSDGIEGVKSCSLEDGARGERGLWRGVITQALMDAGSESSKREAKFDRAQAVAWLSGATKDFHMVCSLAGLDSDYVRRKAKEAIKRGCSWRQEEIRRIKAKKRMKVKKTKLQSLEPTPMVKLSLHNL